MSVPGQLAPGQLLALTRTVDARCPDPLELLRHLNSGEREGSLVLETGVSSHGDPGRTLVVTRSALALRCHRQTVSIEGLTDNGRALIPWLARRLGSLPDAAIDLGEQATPSDERARLTVRFAPPAGGSEEARVKRGGPLDVARLLLRELDELYELPSARALLAGTFAYDLIGSYEQLPDEQEDPLGWPDYELWLPDRMVWLDPRGGRATVVVYVFGGSAAPYEYNDASAAIGSTVAALARAALPPHRELSLPPRAVATAPPSIGQPQCDQDDDAYAATVERLKQHVRAGDVFQIVPSRQFSLPCSDPAAAYERLRELNPSPYMFYVNGSRGVLFGASPEMALRVAGDPPVAQVRPIAGTRPRGRDARGEIDWDLDARLEAELRLDPKELAEHMMLVDLARNDLARVCEPGSRRVDALLTVERYFQVMHLVSQVSGRLRGDLDALHAYAATMNMGTLVGAPKLRAAELLRLHERTRRGPYGGAVGYATSDGAMNTGIVIRSAVVRGGVASVRAGAGVVYDSDPQAEAEETRRKAAAVLRAIASSAQEPVTR